jgi:hypothetical protein
MTTPHRQRLVDTTAPAVRCHYATDPTRRPHCTLTAHARYATIPLCPTCAQQRSTLGKGHTPVPLPATPPLDVLTWITHAQAAVQEADHTLTAAITRARSQGHTWTQIGNQLGTTRQAAQQRLKPQRG